MNVKDQHSRARNEVSCSGTNKLPGREVFGLLFNACVKPTYSSFTIRHVRRDDDPSLLSHAKPLQGFIHPPDHVSHADVSVVGAVPLIAGKETQSHFPLNFIGFLGKGKSLGSTSSRRPCRPGSCRCSGSGCNLRRLSGGCSPRAPPSPPRSDRL